MTASSESSPWLLRTCLIVASSSGSIVMSVRLSLLGMRHLFGGGTGVEEGAALPRAVAHTFFVQVAKAYQLAGLSHDHFPHERCFANALKVGVSGDDGIFVLIQVNAFLGAEALSVLIHEVLPYAVRERGLIGDESVGFVLAQAAKREHADSGGK